MTVGSLFTGIGGFDLAAESAGMNVVWQSEIDQHASSVLDYRWPVVPNLGDIHEIETAPGVDVLTGGFPCQDYSVAGRRGGLAGDRGALWWQFHRLIAEGRPTWVVGENVPGLLSSRDGRDFATIIDSLVDLGYGVVWRVLDAQWFGVAQRRRRVFIVGHSGGEPRPEVLALGQSVSGDSPPRPATGQGVAALTANGLGGGGPDDNLGQAGHLVVAALTAKMAKGTGGPAGDEAQNLIAFNWREELTDGHIDISPTAKDDNQAIVTFAQNTRDEVREIGANLVGALAAQPGMKQQTYLAGTSSVRRLTPLECERLQGFPDGWTATPGNSDTQRYRQLGNAVAVPVAEWIMRRIAAYE